MKDGRMGDAHPTDASQTPPPPDVETGTPIEGTVTHIAPEEGDDSVAPATVDNMGDPIVRPPEHPSVRVT